MATLPGYSRRLNQALVYRGMNVSQLTKLVQEVLPKARGATYATIRRYAGNDPNTPIEHPQNEVLRACAKILEILPAWLIDGAEPMTAAEEPIGVIEEEEEPDARNALRGEILANLPTEIHQSRVVRSLFWAALRRRVRLHWRAEELTARDYHGLAQGLASFLVTPLREISEGRWLSDGEWEGYSIAMLHALMLAMPEEVQPGAIMTEKYVTVTSGVPAKED